MTDRIDLKGIEVYARHGVLDIEQEKAQMFRVDVTAFADLSEAGGSDNLADTLDYGLLANEVREVVGGESHALIERVATRVADVVLSPRRGGTGPWSRSTNPMRRSMSLSRTSR